MHVKEIHNLDRLIWQFVVTQIVVLVVAGVLLWLIHALLKSEERRSQGRMRSQSPLFDYFSDSQHLPVI